jgi:hypothetical protein
VRIQALAVELDTARAWANLNFLTSEHEMTADDGSKP